MINIPNTNHIIRFCPKYTLDENGNPTGDAFKLRKDEEYISVDWYEFFLTKNEKLEELEIFTLIKDTLEKRNYKPSKNGVFSFHNVDKVKRKNYKNIHFEVKNTENNSSHSGIFPNPIRLYESELIAETVDKTVLLSDLSQM
jgi:hypothetical protein